MGDETSGERCDPVLPGAGDCGGGAARTALVIGIVVSAALAFGWPTRHGAFLRGDDQRLVVEQVFVNHPSLEHAWKLLTSLHGDLYQPLPMLTFQANYALAELEPDARFGISPYGFHLTNIFLHALNAALAALIAWRIARCGWVALLVGMMFACHPLALEPVAWISGRMILLATAFSLMLILLCLGRPQDGRGRWKWLGGLAWLLALLSKVLPGVPIAAAWCDWRTRGSLPRRCWVFYAILLVMGAAATWYAVTTTARFGMIASTAAESTTSGPVRALLAGRYYLEHYVWPGGLAAWSPPAEDVALFSTDVGIALLEWIAFGVLAFLAWRRERGTCFVGLVLFLILLAPFLSATVARRMLAADRYMYLPMIGLHLAVGAAVLLVRDGMVRWIRPRAATGLVAVACLAVIAVWMRAGWNHAEHWKSTVARDRRVVEVYPDRVEARIELARAHIFEKSPDDALAGIARARRRWPDDPMLASEAGEAYRQKEDWKSAERELADAADRMPERSRTLYYYALTLEQLGKTREARTLYQRILERSELFLPAVTALARSYRSTQEIETAIHMFERAVSINPYHRDSLFELALLEMGRQAWQQATALLQSILDIDPSDLPAMLNLGAATAYLDKPREAVAIYDRLLAIDAGCTPARVNRARLLVGVGRSQEAEEEYRRILRLDPLCRSAAVGLHELFQRQGRFDALVALWLSFATSGNGSVEARAWLAWAYALASAPDQVRKAVATVPRDDPAYPLATWALAYDALRRGDSQNLRSVLGAPRVSRTVDSVRREQARLVSAALSALPRALRESPAGMYALGRALLFEGDAASARSVSLGLLRMPGADDWQIAARELLSVLDAGNAREPSPPSAGG